MIGTIKEIRTVDGQHVASVLIYGGPDVVTAVVMQPGNIDFHPIPGDGVLCHENGREIVISAVFANDASAQLGETLIFARNPAGQVSASIHLKADGSVVVGDGSDFAAMATKVQALWTCLFTALKAWTGSKTPDGGVALAAALVTAFTSAALDPPNVASQNLKAD